MKHILTVLLGLCVATVSVASDKKNIPSALLYLGKPIDCYFCENTDKNNPDDLDLKTCEKGYSELYNKDYEPGKPTLSNEDKGYRYKYPDGGNCEYRIFDAGKDQYWLDQSCSHVGGDHEITGVVNLVKRKNNTTLQSQYVIGGGDCRALGGDFCSTIIKYNKDGLLVNMSIGLHSMLSEDFLFENKKPQYLQSNDITGNIDNVAKAVAFYKINVSDPVHPQFQYLKLQDESLMVDTNKANAESLSKAEQSEDINECFDNLRDSFIFKGKTKLNKAETKEFLQTFVDVCVTAKKDRSSS